MGAEGHGEQNSLSVATVKKPARHDLAFPPLEGSSSSSSSPPEDPLTARPPSCASLFFEKKHIVCGRVFWLYEVWSSVPVRHVAAGAPQCCIGGGCSALVSTVRVGASGAKGRSLTLLLSLLIVAGGQAVASCSFATIPRDGARKETKGEIFELEQKKEKERRLSRAPDQ